MNDNTSSLSLLVSVRNADEARIAADSNVDIVDIKEPSAGALGRPSLQTVESVVTFARARAGFPPLSIAMGALVEWETTAAEQWGNAPIWEQISFAKIGPEHCSERDWLQRWNEWQTVLPHHVKRVAVAYADHAAACAPPANWIVKRVVDQNVDGLLLDTFEKNGANLFSFFSPSQLEQLVLAAHTAEKFLAVAGSLSLSDFAQVKGIGADIVAVRGAACNGDRRAKLCSRQLATLRTEVERLRTTSSNPIFERSARR